MRKALFSWVLVAWATWGTAARAEGDAAPSTWMLQPNPYDAPASDPADTPPLPAPGPAVAPAPAAASSSVATMQNTPIVAPPIETGTATVSFAVRTEAGADIPHARVLMDGSLLNDALQGWAVTIPAGTHVFEFRGPGFVSQEHPVVIHAGVVAELVTVALARADESTPRFSPAIDPWNARTVVFQPRTALTTPASGAPSQSGDPWLVTFVTGGTAVAALGLGTALGISANNQISELRQSCAPNCNASQIDSVRSKMAVADVAFGVGIVSGGVAVVWALTHRREDLRDASERNKVGFDLRGISGRF